MEKRIEKQLMTIFPNSNLSLYLPTNGIVPSIVNNYNEFIDDLSKIFFKIIENSGIEYFLFAGSAIGLSRDGKNIPWVDDYDILIFEENLEKLKENVFPKLLKNGFEIIDKKGMIHILSKKFQSFSNYSNYFQCDIFVSNIKNGIVRNISNSGLYHNKNININLVRPANFQKFNGQILPFFNKFNEDIKLEYTCVEKYCIIYIEHGMKKIAIPFPWKNVYDVFEKIKLKSKENTKSLINNSKFLKSYEFNTIIEYTNFELDKEIKLSNLSDKIINTLKILNFINQKKLNDIVINLELLDYCCSIRFFFPTIKIVIQTEKINKEDIVLLNYLDEIETKDEKLIKELEDDELIWFKKPLIKLISI